MLLQKSKESIIKIPAFQAELHCAVGRLMEQPWWPWSFSATYLDPLMSRWSCPWSRLLAAAFIYPSCRNEESQGNDGAGTVPFLLAVKCDPCTSLILNTTLGCGQQHPASPAAHLSPWVWCPPALGSVPALVQDSFAPSYGPE